jgi:hypothetical protein
MRVPLCGYASTVQCLCTTVTPSFSASEYYYLKHNVYAQDKFRDVNLYVGMTAGIQNKIKPPKYFLNFITNL